MHIPSKVHIQGAIQEQTGPLIATPSLIAKNTQIITFTVAHDRFIDQIITFRSHES
jgi:hypothetical protein